MWRKSKQDKLDPIRVNPYTERLDPNRLILRIDKELPKQMKSRAEIEDPNLLIPQILREEPTRKKLLILMELPK